jgi:sucrose-phosphate synthase
MTKRGLYIQLFSIHGLVRHRNMELGRDADTGGQVLYVVELAQHLSRHKDVERVDLMTRRITDKSVSADYGEPLVQVNDKFRIARIPCGGGKYIRKELLWPHLDEYVDKTIQFIRSQDRIPDIVHGHYADAGYVAAQLAQLFDIGFVFTGHSLGRQKQERLLKDGMRQTDIIKKYRIDHRIRVEEEVLKSCDLVVTSTRQEMEKQYGAYADHHQPERFCVIPPGIDVDRFYPYYHDIAGEGERSEAALFARASVIEEMNRFFMQPEKPLVLALSRPDKRKNISGLIQAFGSDRELSAMANLAVFAGIRKDITRMGDNEKDVLTMMLLSMDKYDLYGKMAIPKRHDFEHEVPELYRVAAERKGVFVNVALTEPFGLTLIEAAATGLPIVATKDGGPRDIIANCDCGLLVDPLNPEEISGAIKTLLTRPDAWKRCSRNGVMNVRRHYTWKSHVDLYVKSLRKTLAETGKKGMAVAHPSNAIGRRLLRLDRFLITDIDNTLAGADNSRLAELSGIIKKNRRRLGFGVATGRSVSSAVALLEDLGLEPPDMVIASVGAELYYGRRLYFSNGWATHIAKDWNREKIAGLLAGLPFLDYQREEVQRDFKISYNMDPDRDRLARVHEILARNRCRYTLIYSHEKYLDILPFRASKGKAIRYLAYKWQVPLSHFLVCGDSGNDEEMLRGDIRGVVVGNYSPEIRHLKGRRNIYFAKAPCAGGIIEGLSHYRFLEKPDPQKGEAP